MYDYLEGGCGCRYSQSGVDQTTARTSINIHISSIYFLYTVPTQAQVFWTGAERDIAITAQAYTHRQYTLMKNIHNIDIQITT